MANYISDDDISKAKSVFMSSSISIPTLAKLSGQLIGKQIPLQRLKEESERDPNGSWQNQRQAAAGESNDIGVEVEGLRKALYEQIILQSMSGMILTGDFDEWQVRDLLKKVKGVKISRGTGRVEPSLINSYMNLLSKMNISLVSSGVSGKSDLQKVLEGARKEGLSARRRDG